MPEGPEVAIMCDYARSILCDPDAKLTGLAFLSGRYLNSYPEHFPDYHTLLLTKGDVVKSVNRVGKFSWWEMESGWKVSITFGMSGMFKREPTQDDLTKLNEGKKKKQTMGDLRKHFRVQIVVNGDQPCKEKNFYYQDMRSFGVWEFFPPGKDQNLLKKIKDLGHDILQLSLNDSEIVTACRRYNSYSICKLLMEQKWAFSGVGNYLKAEILYRCKVSPHAVVRDIDDSTLVNIIRTGHQLANQAYGMGGTSLILFSGHDYQDGGFHTQLLVYNKIRDPLGHTVLQDKKTADNRTTWWVKEVQTIGLPSNRPQQVLSAAPVKGKMKAIPVKKEKIKLVPRKQDSS